MRNISDKRQNARRRNGLRRAFVGLGARMEIDSSQITHTGTTKFSRSMAPSWGFMQTMAPFDNGRHRAAVDPRKNAIFAQNV